MTPPANEQVQMLSGDGLRFRRHAGRVAFTLMGFLSYLVFLGLLWLRPLVQRFLRVVSSLTLVATIICFFAVPAGSRNVLWIIGGLSFTFFLMAWFYDWVLLKLAPEPIRLFD